MYLNKNEKRTSFEQFNLRRARFRLVSTKPCFYKKKKQVGYRRKKAFNVRTDESKNSSRESETKNLGHQTATA